MSDRPWTPPGSGEPVDPPPPSGVPGQPPPPGFGPAPGSVPGHGPAPGRPPGYGPAPGYPPAPGPAYGSSAGGPAPGPAPPPGSWQSVEFRPGIIPLRPLTLGDIYGAVIKAVRGNPAATIGLATLTTFAFLLPTTALGSWLATADSVPLDGPSSGSSTTFGASLGLGLLGVYLPSLGQLLSGILLAGFLAQVVGQAVLGRRVGLGETWTGTRDRLLPMIGAVLVTVLVGLVAAAVLLGGPAAVAVAGGTSGDNTVLLTGLALLVVGALATIVLALYLGTKWAFATPAIVLERVGVLAGLRRSWGLVASPLRGPFWRILGIRLLTSIIVGVAASVVSVPIAFVVTLVLAGAAGDGGTTGDLFLTQTVATGISGLITGALTTPFTAGVDALLYVDSRIRREGLDVRLVQTAQGAAPPPWPLTRP